MSKGVKVLLIIAACFAALGLLLMGLGLVTGVRGGVSEGFDLTKRILFGDNFTESTEAIQTSAPVDTVPTPAPEGSESWTVAPGITVPTPTPTPMPTPSDTEDHVLQPTPVPTASSAVSSDPIPVPVNAGGVMIELDDLPAFHKILVDVTLADVSILPANSGSGYLYIHYEDSRHNPTYTVENGVLRIKDDPYKVQWDGSNFKEILQDLVSLSFIKKGTVEIYLPSGAAYDEIDIAAVTGDLECTAPIIGKDLAFDVTTGDIRISDGSYDKIDAECVTGDIRIFGGTYGKVDAECVTGDIHLEGVLGGNISLSVITGDQSIASTLPESDYRIEASCTSGNVIINRKHHGNTYQGGTGKCAIEAETVTGEIHMSFAE